jgi:hypothetical protein
MFCSPEKTQRLADMVQGHETMNLYAVNVRGDEIKQGAYPGGITALTWGVFPSREILQPTVFDSNTFLVWAEEAFSLWTHMWLNLYEFDSESYELIENIKDTHYLCNHRQRLCIAKLKRARRFKATPKLLIARESKTNDSFAKTAYGRKQILIAVTLKLQSMLCLMLSAFSRLKVDRVLATQGKYFTYPHRYNIQYEKRRESK